MKKMVSYKVLHIYKQFCSFLNYYKFSLFYVIYFVEININILIFEIYVVYNSKILMYKTTKRLIAKGKESVMMLRPHNVLMLRKGGASLQIFYTFYANFFCIQW